MIPPFSWFNSPPMASPRVLRAADARACSRIHATSFAHPWSAAEFEALLIDSTCVGDGVEEKAGLAGFVLSRRALDEAEILTIVVDPATRKKGCGRRLLGAHVARLAGLGISRLFLEVDEKNTAALALYRQFGFAVIGKRKEYYSQSDGSRSDAVAMLRILA
jgi:[ribosomal protein S18]-alanine N-acetyltransferase